LDSFTRRNRGKNYDLKAANPYAKNDEGTRTPEKLLNVIESKGREVTQILEELRMWRRAF
jgi:hypothetical protein